jgi:hypothetical protein
VIAHTARAEETVREKFALLEATRSKEAKADQRASALRGELVATRQDAAKEKVLSLATKAVVAN